jgi:hypothetical protein
MKSADPGNTVASKASLGIAMGCGTGVGPAVRRARYQFSFGVFTASIRDILDLAFFFVAQQMKSANPSRTVVFKACLGSAGGVPRGLRDMQP